MINIKIKGLERALKHYQELSKLDDKMNEFYSKLAEVGINAAQLYLASADTEPNNDLLLTTCMVLPVAEKIPDGCRIIAQGDGIAFIEYGYGPPLLGDQHETATEYGNNFVAGSWSEGPLGKGHWNLPQGWIAPVGGNFVQAYGMGPQRFMYKATREMQQEIHRVAREVFGKND